MTSYSVLVVGCGMVASGYDEQSRTPDAVLSHAGAYRRHPAFRLGACVEPNLRRRSEFMSHWSVPRGFATLDEALASGLDFDVVSVCTPTANHAEALERLLAGRHRLVFCEKPLTNDLAAAEALVSRYRGANKHLAVGFTRRWDPAMQAIKARLDSRALGNLQFAVAHYTKGLLHNGSHMIDLLQMLLGPLSIQGGVSGRPLYAPHDLSVDAILASQSGARVHLIAADAHEFDLFELHLLMQRARLSILDSGFRTSLAMREQDPCFPGHYRLGATTVEPTGLATALLEAVKNIAGVLNGTAELQSDGASALSGQRLCHQLYAAATDAR
jgi:predicted dehydrogenase